MTFIRTIKGHKYLYKSYRKDGKPTSEFLGRADIKMQIFLFIERLFKKIGLLENKYERRN